MKCVVIDWSSERFLLAGYCGESFPFYSIPLPPSLEVKEQSEESHWQWEDLYLSVSNLFRRIFSDFLRVRPKQIHVLVVEPVFLSRVVRDCIFTVLLNDFHVAGISFQPAHQMVALSSGTSAGCIVQIEERDSVVVCFSHHRVVVSSLRFGAGLSACYEELSHLLQAKGIPSELLTTALLRRALTGLCEHRSRLLSERKDEAGDVAEEELLTLSEKIFLLNDAKPCFTNSITLSAREVSECLSPLLYGCGVVAREGVTSDYSERGLYDLIIDSCQQMHLEDRSHAMNNLILAGSGFKLPGLKNIVLSELSSATSRARPHQTAHTAHTAHTAQTTAFRLSSVSSLVETDKLTWLGGSIFASLECNEQSFSLSDALKSPESRTSEFSQLSESLQKRVSAPDWMAINSN
eukprot:gene10286-11188_t